MPKKIIKNNKLLEYKFLKQADAQRIILQSVSKKGKLNEHLCRCLVISELCDKGKEELKNINIDYILGAMEDYSNLIIYWNAIKDSFIKNLEEENKKPKLRLVK